MKALRVVAAMLACAAMLGLLLPWGDVSPAAPAGGVVPGSAAAAVPARGISDGRIGAAADLAGRQAVDEDPRSTADVASLVLRVVSSDTREPVPNVPLRLSREDGRAPERTVVRTGADGLAVVEEVAAGELFVIPGGERIAVAERGRTECELVLDRFFEVRGVVVDARGDPIGGATVWSADTELSELGASEIAVTGADGRFGWTAWSPSENLFATAEGFAASPVYDLLGSPQDAPPELWIALRTAVGAVAGTVVDELGRPVADALVALSPPAAAPVDPDREASFFRAHPRRSPQRVAVTDASGSFRFGDLAAGRAMVRVRTTAGAQSGTWLDVATAAETHVQIVVGAPRVVRGNVADDLGRPLADAVVAYGHLGGFERVVTRSDAEGRYELRGLPGDSARVSATKRGYAELGESVTLSGAEPARLDFVLRRHRLLRGRLLDASGTPLAGWWIGEAHGASGLQETDAQGVFDLRDVQDPAAELTAFEPMDAQPHGLRPPRLLRADPPRDGEVRAYRPAPESEPTAWVTGRVLADPDALTAPARVEVRSEHPSWRRSARIDRDGRFELGPLPPGTYTLEVAGDALPRQPLGAHALAPQQRLDLGAIATRPAVQLHIDVASADGEHPIRVRATLRDADGAQWRVRLDAPGLLSAEPLPPGRYELRVEAPDLQPQRVELELRPGQPAHVRVTLR